MAKATCENCQYYWPCDCGSGAPDDEQGDHPLDYVHGSCCYYPPEDEGEETPTVVAADRPGCHKHQDYQRPMMDWPVFIEQLGELVERVYAMQEAVGHGKGIKV